MTTQILNFGCRLNAYEGEVMRGHTAHLADTLVVNTCAVTGEAERQARRAITRAHREAPGRAIVVTGCAAQVAPDRWAALPGVSRVLGNAEKLRAQSWAAGAPASVSDIMQAGAIPAYPVAGFTGRARALVQVQQGCDHRCTFCVIPCGRGPNRSVPAEAVVDQVRALVTRGYNEVVLTGVDIASYGAGLAHPSLVRPGLARLDPSLSGLGALVGRVLAGVPALPRLRLSSIDPAAIDEHLWALIGGEPRLMPHLHLSLQAGSDLILKRMKRRHSVAQAGGLIARARALRPGIAIGADLIAGFPTETDALFAETLAFVRDHALPYLHVFPYSERPGTPAARMPAVPPPERRTRAALLRAEGQAACAAFHAGQVGGTAQVLTESARDGAPNGHTQHFAPVRLAGTWPPGRLVAARITGADAQGLRAEAA